MLPLQRCRHRFEFHYPINRVWPDGRPPQRRQVCARPEQSTDLTRETADVRPLAAPDDHLQLGPIIPRQLDRIDSDLPRWQLDFIAIPRQLVGPLPANLDRAEGWRRLIDQARESIQCLANL